MEARAGLLAWIDRWIAGQPPANIWLGITVVNQAEADRDVPKLLRVPAAVRFLSVEPMLGPIHLDEFHPSREPAQPKLLDGISWVICGGESGPKARPMHPDWARSLRDQCASAGVPFLFKQWGEWISDDDIDGAALLAPQISDPNEYFNECEWEAGVSSWRIGKKAAGRLLDGRTHDEFPAA